MVGIDTDNVEIDKYVVAEYFWGMVDDELDNKLAELEEDEAEEEKAFFYYSSTMEKATDLKNQWLFHYWWAPLGLEPGNLEITKS
jgi:hypothetical protein